MSHCSILFSFLFLILFVPLLYKFGSSFSVALPSFFTSRFFTIFFFWSLRILSRPCPYCCAAGHLSHLFFSAGVCLYGLFSSIFGGIATRLDLLYISINILPFGSLTCICLVLFTNIILSRGCIFCRLIFDLFN